MSEDLKCPMCQSTDIETYKDNPDDKGMCWYTYHECRKCGRTCRDYDWLKLTDYEKETIKTKMLTAEVELLKAEIKRIKMLIIFRRDWVLKTMIEHNAAQFVAECNTLNTLLEAINNPNTWKGGEDE